MRVLVTGGGGFLGSHLVERLENDGHDVVVARSADYDLTSMEETARMFAEAAPERVFHLAAEVGGIGANRANPGRYWYANLMMGAHVLEQARLHETPKLVIVGTVCAYPKFAPVPFREDDLWNGYPEETNAPYGVAKKAVLVGAQAYREQYGRRTPMFLLPTNLYGPRDNFDLETSHVIPALIRKMIEAEDEVVLWGDGSPTREFLYVEDCVEGLVLAAERYDGPEPVNLGAGKEISIRELAELVADVTGFEGRIVWDAKKPNGQPRRSVDATRARELFGFEARTPLRDGIERTVAWYRSGASPVSVASTSVAAARGAGRTVDRLLDAPRAVLGDAHRRRRSSRRSCSRSPSTHNGWVYFQGGDQIVNTTTGLAARPARARPDRGRLPLAVRPGADHVGHGRRRSCRRCRRSSSSRCSSSARWRFSASTGSRRRSAAGCSATGRRCCGSSRRSPRSRSSSTATTRSGSTSSSPRRSG